ncbi:MAG: anthranilate synthase component I family protein [Candidatus Eisenbacteria bacterium]
MSAEEHGRRVREILHWIGRGHIYQANLTYPIQARFVGEPASLYQALRTHNAAPFGAYLAPAVPHPESTDDRPRPDRSERAATRTRRAIPTILSSSPELFLRIHGRTIETRPIKGTARRDLGNPGRDRCLAHDLFRSAKDRAELTMIVDLERNDLGRLCRPGTVRTLPFPRVESFRRVHHLAATVRGELARPVTLDEIFATTFPGGSVTGAPKIRAMEILRDLEIGPRWVYTGTLGMIDDRGRAHLSLTIRTLWIENDHAVLHVGGGIVADSVPEREWEETRDKAAAMLDALESGWIDPTRRGRSIPSPVSAV